MSRRPPDDAPIRFTVSRRTFLTTVGAGAAATGLTVHVPRPAEAAILGPDAVPLPLKVNGVTHALTLGYASK